VANDVVYFSGGFTQVLGQPRRHLAAIGVNGVLRDWRPRAVDSTMPVLRSRGGNVYVSGQYTVVPEAPP
jgi:hypothetical protein